MDQDLLAPHAGPLVQLITDDSSEWAEDDVQETEHGSPIAGAGLLERREVFEVVGAKDTVNGKFGTKGTEVAAACDEGLGGEDDGKSVAEGGFDDNLAASSVEHLLFANLCFMSETFRLLGLYGLEAELLFVVAAVARAIGAVGFAIGQFSWYIDNGACDAVMCEVGLSG